ncbi:MAG: cell division protein FtsQ/DivIB [Paracoccaceae bacterium]
MRPLRGAFRRAADPAPSLWAYRLERLLLTPLYRRALTLGVPALCGLAAVWVYFSDAERAEKVQLALSEMRAAFESRPEFQVNLMAIDGAGRGVSEDIREILQLDFPMSSFDLDLDALREVVTGLDAVKSANLRIRPGGVLQVEVVERTPVAIWRHAEGLDLLDAEGVVVGPLAARGARPDLPLVAGEGAREAMSEALELAAAAGPLLPRMRGLVRVGERRWDVMLDRDQRLMLPPETPVRALERIIAMDQAQDMLSRDVAAVDMRLPRRPTVRLNGPAVEELHRIRQIEWGDTD